MSPGRQQRSDTRLVQHVTYGQSVTGADTLVLMGTSTFLFAPDGTSVNIPIPSACMMRRIALHTLVAGVNVAGNWTMNLFKNGTAVPPGDATFTFNPVNLSDKFVGIWTPEIRFEAGDTYWLAATGPSRNIIAIRATTEMLVF